MITRRCHKLEYASHAQYVTQQLNKLLETGERVAAVYRVADNLMVITESFGLGPSDDKKTPGS